MREAPAEPYQGSGDCKGEVVSSVWGSDGRTAAGWVLESNTRAPSVATTVNRDGLREEGHTDNQKYVLMSQEELRGKKRLQEMLDGDVHI